MSKEVGCLVEMLDALDALTDAVDRRAPLVAAVALWALCCVAAIFVGFAVALLALTAYGDAMRWVALTPALWGRLALNLAPLVAVGLACAWMAHHLAVWRAAETWAPDDDETPARWEEDCGHGERP